MTAKFDAFVQALDALCREHKVDLDTQIGFGNLPVLRVFNAPEINEYPTLEVGLIDCTDSNLN